MVFCILSIFFPLGNLLAVKSSFIRFVLASLLTFSPVFFANLIFSLTLRDRPLAEHLFGWNLLGAALGGILEYTRMAVGYNFLSCLLLLSYGLVFVLIMIDKKPPRALSPVPAASQPRRRSTAP